MASQLMGSEYVMMDGTSLVTEVIGDGSEGRCLDIILKDMIKHKDMVAGLDITWSQPNTNRALILAICTRTGCILVRISGYQNYPYSLANFLDNKDITFFGVHMKEDVKRMRKQLYFGIRNIVDASDLAADVLHRPWLRALGVRRLASDVLFLWSPLEARSFSTTLFNLTESALNTYQIECVTTDAYAAYKIGKKLLECH